MELNFVLSRPTLGDGILGKGHALYKGEELAFSIHSHAERLGLFMMPTTGPLTAGARLDKKRIVRIEIVTAVASDQHVDLVCKLVSQCREVFFKLGESTSSQMSLDPTVS